ncbi:MAG: M23 family metallopeptidase [Fibrobacter sp.]|nr:M23 family metallopeptidase [Fibrobacter sp.]
MTGRLRRNPLCFSIISILKGSRFFFISEKNSSQFFQITRVKLLLILFLFTLTLGGACRGILYLFLQARNLVSIQLENRKSNQLNICQNLLSGYLCEVLESFDSQPVKGGEIEGGLGCGVYKAGLRSVDYNNLLTGSFSSFFNLSSLKLQPEILDRPVFREDQMQGRISFLCPVEGQITSYFGNRTDPVFEGAAHHNGIDIAGRLWSPVYCSFAGRVIFAGNRSRWGNVVIVDHGENGYQTIYAHLQKISTKKGHTLSAGQVIGYLGNTGKSTGPHLHYEVRQMAKPMDPLLVLIPSDTVVD